MLRAGVDLGGTKIQTVIVDNEGTVLGQCRLPTPKTAVRPESSMPLCSPFAAHWAMPVRPSRTYWASA